MSINALREDLQLAHKTIANWLQILERLYAIYRLSPFGAPRIRAVKKEQKHYHWDWSVVRMWVNMKCARRVRHHSRFALVEAPWIIDSLQMP